MTIKLSTQTGFFNVCADGAKAELKTGAVLERSLVNAVSVTFRQLAKILPEVAETYIEHCHDRAKAIPEDHMPELTRLCLIDEDMVIKDHVIAIVLSSTVRQGQEWAILEPFKNEADHMWQPESKVTKPAPVRKPELVPV